MPSNASSNPHPSPDSATNASRGSAQAPEGESSDAPSPGGRNNFIYDIIDEDLADGTHDGRVYTRFPPEPNGYPHIGHAKSIVLNFGIKRDYADVAETQCHLRFDDTNPETEKQEYVESMKKAVQWLGYDYGEHLYFASDYLEQFYQYAVKLIKQGDAYVDSLSEEEIREYRGTVNEPGKPSPYRDRSVEENLDLFRRMRDGEFEEGEHVLRAKIDMSSPHMIMRDPLLFRITHAEHYRQGTDWCIYPMYDFAHCLEDAIEDITHSLCTLEFDNNRRVYDWVLEHCLEPDELPQRPHQYEFARLNLGYTVLSKRRLRRLVEEGHVEGWDDPRLFTIAGLKRRGVPPAAIRQFCRDVGVTRSESRVEISLFEHAVRDELNFTAPRVMGVLDPIEVTITNFPEDETDWLEVPHWPREIDKDDARSVPFTRTLYIERDDFREDPPSDFHRLAPGREVRLRYGYFVTCEEVVRDDDGQIKELRCTYDPETRGGQAPDGRNPAGTIHWVSAGHAHPATIREYDRLFDVPAPDGGDEDFIEHLNPDSLIVKEGFVEPAAAELARSGTRVQFERQGYYWPDPEDSLPNALVFNRIVPLRDPWADDEDQMSAEEMERKRREKAKQKERQRQRSMEAQRDATEKLDPEQRVRYVRFRDDYGLNHEDAAIIASDDALADFFTESLDHHDAPRLTANWIVNELKRETKERALSDLPFSPEAFAGLIRLVDEEAVTSRGAQTVFETLVAEGGDPDAIVDARDLRRVEDTDALADVVAGVVADHPDEAERYRNGKEGLIGFFMGQVMEATQGSADPELARSLLRDELNDES